MKPAGTAVPAQRRGGAAIVRAGLLSVLAMAALGVTRLIHTVLVSHASDEAVLGLVGTLVSLTLIASLLLPGGAASAASKFISFHRGAGDEAAARGVHRFLATVGTASSALLGVAVGLGAYRWYDLTGGDALWVGVLATAFSLYTIDKATLYGFALVPAYVRLELTCSALAIAATIAVVATGSTAYLAPLALSYGAFVLVARWVLRPAVRGSRGHFDRGEVLRYTGLASIGTLASAGFLQGTLPLARHFATPAESAYFVAAVALVAPMYFLPRALGVALFPSMAEAHGAGDTDAVRSQADVSTRALLVLLAPLFAAGTFAAPIALLIFRPQFAAGAPVLQVLLTATFLAVAQVGCVNALSSGTARQVRIPVLSAVVGALVGLVAVAVLGGPFGAAGISAGYLLGTAVSAAGPLAAVWWLYRMPWSGPVVRSVVVVTVALAAALALGPVPGWADVLLTVTAAALGVLLLHRDIAGVLPAGVLHRLARFPRRRAIGSSRTGVDGAGVDAPQ